MVSIKELDHALILVRDLNDADVAMRRLGFKATPRGVHSEHMGTANSTIMFDDMTYFEIIGVLEPTPSNFDMREMLEHGEGLLGIAMKTDDARATVVELSEVSAAGGEAVNFSRPVDMPAGPEEAAFSVANIDSARSLGIKMFACQHHTPNVVWRPGYIEQPNGAIGVSAVVGSTSDLDEAERQMTVLFGDRVTTEGGAVTVKFDNASIAFKTRARLHQDHGIYVNGETKLQVLQLRTRSREVTRRTLRENHIDFTDRGKDTVSVPPQAACGATIEFVSK
ncbi:MAG: VOC family protein [Hyphomicrobiales bacterium]